MANMTGATKKQQWLERETLRVHDAIERDLDSYLNRAHRQYERNYKILLQEVKKLNRDFELGKISSDFMELRTNVLISQLEDRVRELNFQIEKEMPEKLAKYANYSREGMDKILTRLGVISLPTSTFEFASTFRYEDYTFQSSFNKAGIKLGTRLNDIMTEGIAKGWDNRKYAKKILEVEEFTKFEANRIARTETARAATEGSRQTLKEYGVEKVQWSAALERRTCQICAGLHNKKFKLGAEPPLPRHPFCRCVLLPVVEDI